MEVQKRLYTVDDVWEMQSLPGNADKNYELINGALVTTMSPTNFFHSWLASEISGFVRDFVRPRNLGYVSVEGGFYPKRDRSTLLSPDVAFVRRSRISMPLPETFIGFMPDLAVEIVSPSNTMDELGEKAAIYLQHGTQLVWIVIPGKIGVEVYRKAEDGQIASEFVGADGTLSGEDVLPGFTLEVQQLFPALDN